MLKSLEIKGLNGKIDHVIEFNPDITILTGPNGSGKTNILKLIWYLFSPNVERAYEEIDFESATLTTDLFKLTLNKLEHTADFISSQNQSISISITDSGLNDKKKPTYSERRIGRYTRNSFQIELDDINGAILSLKEQSLFFPTYRRIEEGRNSANNEMYEVATALRALANRISVGGHKLIASVSADDIVRLLSNRYAATSNKALSYRDDLLKNITKTLEDSRNKATGNHTSLSSDMVIDQIIKMVENADNAQEELFAPFSSINEILKGFVCDKSIRIDSNYIIGEIGNEINVDLLSAGEKQVLSFLAYNSFYSNSLIVIDEPELSLHIDWQRSLLPTLEKQGSNNQIIVATHSPFIYANYPEKEVILSAGLNNG